MFEDIKVGDQVMVGLCSLGTVVSVSSKQFRTSDENGTINRHHKSNGWGVGNDSRAYPLTPENIEKIEGGKVYDAAESVISPFLKKMEKIRACFSAGFYGRSKSKWIHTVNVKEKKKKLSELVVQLDQLLTQAEDLAKEIFG